jgi:hypothetical protein
MRRSSSLSKLSSLNLRILVLLLLTIAVVAILQVLPSAVANASDLAPPAETGLRLGTAPKPEEAVRVRVADAFGKLPLSFEANRGQTDPGVKFLSAIPHTRFFLRPASRSSFS